MRALGVAMGVAAGLALVAAPAAGWALVTAPPASAAVARAAPSGVSSDLSSDIDGDGRADVVTGAPGRSASGHAGAGAVLVRWSALTSSPTASLVTQATAGVVGSPEPRDGFGAAVAVGDFDGDGFDDLAVGAPREDKGSTADAGAVDVLYGSASGLDPHRGLLLWGGAPSAGAAFGSALAVGDANGDGVDDLAIGAPGAPARGSGAVEVYLGGPGGLQPSARARWSQDSSGVAGHAEAGDHFGAALVFGRFDSDSYDDLVVGVPGEALPSGDGARGAVHLLHGSAAGPTARGSSLTFFAALGPADSGGSLAAGDVDADGVDDLVSGYQGLGSPATSVVVQLGSASGALTYDATVNESTPQVPGHDEFGDGFGYALALADLDGDGDADLVATAPGEGLDDVSQAGALVVLPSSGGHLTGAGAAFVSQASPGVPGDPAAADQLGRSVTVVGGSIFVGAPNDNAGSARSGSVTRVAWSASGRGGASRFGVAAAGRSPAAGDALGFSLG